MLVMSAAVGKSFVVIVEKTSLAPSTMFWGKFATAPEPEPSPARISDAMIVEPMPSRKSLGA